MTELEIAQLRMQCLHIASATCGESSSEYVLKTAKEYFDFVYKGK